MAPVMRSALLLAACLAVLGAQGAARAADLSLQALGAQKLEAGQCGLFLWTRDRDQSLLAVAYDAPAVVRVRIDGRVRELRRSGFAGEPQFGHFETQQFSDGAMRVELEVAFDERRTMSDGAVVGRGIMRVANDGGDASVVPVGGLVACKRT